MSDVRVRFAPSPTGSPHIGSVRTALYNWLYARHTGGVFILRIEDTDRTRLVPGSLEEIMQSLEWLGTAYDEGPGVGGAHGPYVQSERLGIYTQYAQQLIDSGHAYRCFCTPERLAEMRKAQEAAKQHTGYDRNCLRLSPEETAARLKDGVPSVIRFKVPEEGVTSFADIVYGEISFENRLLDDFVLVKSDGYPTYQFANVVDDHLMEITHIIRGEEWISSTPKHVLQYRAFGWEPPKFAHSPLLVGPDRAKLGKRHGSVRFLDFVDRGFLPEVMINFTALLGWSPGNDQEIFTTDELIERFSLEGIVNHPVVFDIEKLEWMNGVYIRELGLDRLTDLCIPHLQKAELIPAEVGPDLMEYVRCVIALLQERLKVLSEVGEAARYFFADDFEYDEKGMQKWLSRDYVPDLLGRLAARLEGLSEWTVEGIEAAVREAGEDMDLSGGQVIHPTRMAVTGRTIGPGLFETMAVLGRKQVIARLERAASVVGERPSSTGETDPRS